MSATARPTRSWNGPAENTSKAIASWKPSAAFSLKCPTSGGGKKRGGLSEKAGGDVLEPHDIFDPAGHIEPLDALDRAGAAIPAGVGGNLQLLQKVAGQTRIPVTVGVHIASHKVRDGKSQRAAGQALAAVLAVEPAVEIGFQTLELLLRQGQVGHHRQVFLELVEGGHAGDGGRG